MSTPERDNAILEAVKQEALHRADNYGDGVYEYHLQQQGLVPVDYADWNIDEQGRIHHTVKSVTIGTYDEENEIWYVDVDMTPEVPDVETYEAYFHDDGTIAVSWHGC